MVMRSSWYRSARGNCGTVSGVILVTRGLHRLVMTVCLAAGSLLLAQQQPVPDAPQARFKADADLIQIDVAVLDSRRQPVKGLTAADFSVLEDGQPRAIQAFTEVQLPGRALAKAAPWVRDVPADVVTNQAAVSEGRLVIILLDRTIPGGQATVTARRVAAATVAELGPGDLAAVVSTSGGAVQNLTADPARLLRAINRSDVSSDVSADVRAMITQGAVTEVEGQLVPLDAPATPGADGRCICGLCVLETITRIANAVQDTPRRRKLLFFIGTDLTIQATGLGTSPTEDPGCDRRLRDARNDMFAALDRSNLTIHSVDPVGLATAAPVSRSSSPLTAGRVPAAAARETTENLQRQDALRVLPDRTGGRTVVNANLPDAHVPSIFRESDSYYVLGFRPADPGPNAAFHRVEVKVNRRGLDVQARGGYVSASPPEAARSTAPSALPESLKRALSGLLPDGAVPLDVNVSTFAAPGTAHSTLAVVVGAGEFAAAHPGTQTSVPFEVVVGAFDRTGRPRASARQMLDLTWPPRDTTNRRLNVLSRIDLPPGDYEIRVGLVGADAVRTASVFTYVVVPAYASEPLSLSSIALGATIGTASAPGNFLSSVLPITPTVQRDFARTDRLVGFLRVYQGTSRRDAIAPVTLRTTVLDAQGRVSGSSSTVMSAEQFANRTAEHLVNLPLSDLAPGEYLLRVEATMGSRVVGRAVRFTVGA